jgi:hypothetical protein
MIRLTMAREYPVDGRLHGAVVYRVNGLSDGQRATIESRSIRRDRWEVQRFIDGIRYMGEYPSAEQALAALQEEVDAEMKAANPANGE